MEYIEVVLKSIKISQLQSVFCNYLIFDEKDIISSHFFDREKNTDASYKEIENFEEYFNTPGTCNISLKKATIGAELANVLLHIVCDERYGDITINFDEEQLKGQSNKEIENKLQNILTFLIQIYKSGEIGEIILGYEPAEDTDMKMIEISQNKMKLLNENLNESPVATIVYDIAKEKSM